MNLTSRLCSACLLDSLGSYLLWFIEACILLAFAVECSSSSPVLVFCDRDVFLFIVSCLVILTACVEIVVGKLSSIVYRLKLRLSLLCYSACTVCNSKIKLNK